MNNVFMTVLLISLIFGAAAGIAWVVLPKRKLYAVSNKNTQKTKSQCIDYDIYILSKVESLGCTLLAALVIATISYVFYRSLVLALLLMPFGILYRRVRVKELIKKRKLELNLQFRELLYSVSSSLIAGKAVEAAFYDAHKDLAIQYTDSDCHILKELKYISYRLDMNETIEVILEDFAKRSHIEDIKNFSDVFQACKRAGGDLVQVVKSTTEIISDKINLKQEIECLTVQRRLEQRVLSIIPFALVGLITISSPDFMAPVYNTAQGRVAMTLAIALFAAAHFISGKLMNIEV